MKKRLNHRSVLLITAVLTLSIIGGIFLGSRSSENVTAAQAAVVINLQDMAVMPDTVTVEVGETIEIKNKSSSQRELTLGSGSAHGDEHDHAGGFSTGKFDTDESWVGSFSEPGTYFLHDHDNPDVNVLVVVYKPGQVVSMKDDVEVH